MELVKNFKQSKLIKYIFFALIGSILLAISSKIKIPFYPVPMTMQTFVVMLIGISFGYKIAISTIALYLFCIIKNNIFIYFDIIKNNILKAYLFGFVIQ